MEGLIRRTCAGEIDDPRIGRGQYDLVGPHDEIILPEVWETTVAPHWTVTMHMRASPHTHPHTLEAVRPPSPAAAARTQLEPAFHLL